MAKIYKVEDLFKPLTKEELKVANQNSKKIGSLKGKIIMKRGDIFNLKIS